MPMDPRPGTDRGSSMRGGEPARGRCPPPRRPAARLPVRGVVLLNPPAAFRTLATQPFPTFGAREALAGKAAASAHSPNSSTHSKPGERLCVTHRVLDRLQALPSKSRFTGNVTHISYSSDGSLPTAPFMNSHPRIGRVPSNAIGRDKT